MAGCSACQIFANLFLGETREFNDLRAKKFGFVVFWIVPPPRRPRFDGLAIPNKVSLAWNPIFRNNLSAAPSDPAARAAAWGRAEARGLRGILRRSQSILRPRQRLLRAADDKLLTPQASPVQGTRAFRAAKLDARKVEDEHEFLGGALESHGRAAEVRPFYQRRDLVGQRKDGPRVWRRTRRNIGGQRRLPHTGREHAQRASAQARMARP